MSNPNTSEKSVDLDRQENITKGNLSAKKVALYTYDSGTDSLIPYTSSSSSSGKATDAYSIQAISDDGTYKYFFFEDASANWYILRKTLATSLFLYTKGTGGYASVYVDATSGPSGSPTFASYGATF